MLNPRTVKVTKAINRTANRRMTRMQKISRHRTAAKDPAKNKMVVQTSRVRPATLREIKRTRTPPAGTKVATMVSPIKVIRRVRTTAVVARAEPKVLLNRVAATIPQKQAAADRLTERTRKAPPAPIRMTQMLKRPINPTTAVQKAPTPTTVLAVTRVKADPTKKARETIR